jgi:hypothetical protein
MNELTQDAETKNSGWKPIPLPLKTLSVVFILWSVGAVANLPNLMENGLPLLGTFVYGSSAVLIVSFLDILGPLVFLFALWTRKPWAAKWAFTYIGLFVLNSIVALFTVRAELGVPQIMGPTIASLIFLAIIYWKRDYFNQTA